VRPVHIERRVGRCHFALVERGWGLLWRLAIKRQAKAEPRAKSQEEVVRVRICVI